MTARRKRGLTKEQKAWIEPILQRTALALLNAEIEAMRKMLDESAKPKKRKRVKRRR